MTRPDTATTNTLWLHEVFHRIFDLRDFTTASEFWSEDTVNHFLATGETVRGTTALIQWFSALFAAVPDFTLGDTPAARADKLAQIHETVVKPLM